MTSTPVRTTTNVVGSSVRRVLVTVLLLVAALTGVATWHASSGQPLASAGLTAGTAAVADSAAAAVEMTFAGGARTGLPGSEGVAGCDATCLAECGLLGLTCTALLIVFTRAIRGRALFISSRSRGETATRADGAPVVAVQSTGLSLQQLSISRT
jgi:hypothetical protein